MLKIDLKFFDNSDKTEEATEKKKKEAKKEGRIAKSQELGVALLFLSSFSALKYFFENIFIKLLHIFQNSYDQIYQIDYIFDKDYMQKYVVWIFKNIFFIIAPFLGVIMIVGLLANFIQVGWNPTSKTLKPNFGQLNPMKGIKKLFSFKSIIELIKALAKMGLIYISVKSIIVENLGKIYDLNKMDLMQSNIYIGNLAVAIGQKIGFVYIVIAIIDIFYNKFKHKKDLRMSKQEIKEEAKQSEGNPQIKGAIKNKMREMSMRRMIEDVKSADVVITNPTHYAIAIKYDKNKNLAPLVVAKGADIVALKIKEKAQQNFIEIVESKELAKILYKKVDIGDEIPPELYHAVAEILAFVYSLKNNL